jgi:hypothetical protein
MAGMAGKAAPQVPAQPRGEADTVSPARNFTLTVSDRVNAAIGGVPAYARRLRAIEDLQARLARAIADGAMSSTEARRRSFEEELARLNVLIEQHNRYYPAERNLRSDLRTGAMLDHGRPWRPLDHVTLEILRALAIAQGWSPRSD